jgi:hypothetical protein
MRMKMMRRIKKARDEMTRAGEINERAMRMLPCFFQGGHLEWGTPQSGGCRDRGFSGGSSSLVSRVCHSV